VVIWFHDESTFYVNDHQIVHWVHEGETPVPCTKGEGASSMVANFVSADYGWLTSLDEKEQAHVLFKAGKAHEGYFTNEDILKHATTTMAILDKDYPNEDHVLVFDNATTHLKCEEDALLASKMPKFTPKLGNNWGVEVVELNEDCKIVHETDGKVLKTQIRMTNAKFADDTPQCLYWPNGHECAGIFKGMAAILEE
jgi:hypothetical protein